MAPKHFGSGQRPWRVDPFGWCNTLRSRRSRINEAISQHSCGCRTSILKHSIYVVNYPVFFGPGDGGNIRSIGYATKRGHPFAASTYKVNLISSSSLVIATHHRLDISHTLQKTCCRDKRVYIKDDSRLIFVGKPVCRLPTEAVQWHDCVYHAVSAI